MHTAERFPVKLTPRRKILFIQFGVLALLVLWVINIGEQYQWAYTVFWWDIVAHIGGGVWAGLWCVYIARLFKIHLSIYQIVLGAFAIGLVWEAFEYMNGIGGSVFMSYRLDTGKDLLDDMLGGAIAGFIFKWVYKR